MTQRQIPQGLNAFAQAGLVLTQGSHESGRPAPCSATLWGRLHNSYPLCLGSPIQDGNSAPQSSGVGHQGRGQHLNSRWSPKHQHELGISKALGRRSHPPRSPNCRTLRGTGLRTKDFMLKLKRAVQISPIRSLWRRFIHTKFSLEERPCK